MVKQKTTGALAASVGRRQHDDTSTSEPQVGLDHACERPELLSAETLFEGAHNGKAVRIARDAGGKCWVCGLGEPFETKSVDAMIALLSQQKAAGS